MTAKKSPLRPIRLSRAEIARITARQKKEFPNDWALRQVHIWRGMLRREAELMGMEYFDYIRFLDKYDKERERKVKTKGK